VFARSGFAGLAQTEPTVNLKSLLDTRKILHSLLLGASIIIDVKQRQIPFNYTQVELMEEGCKFVGASQWLFFCGQTAAGKKRPA
jgi:hypothetical protein